MRLNATEIRFSAHQLSQFCTALAPVPRKDSLARVSNIDHRTASRRAQHPFRLLAMEQNSACLSEAINMEHSSSYFRDQADRCRRLARDSTDRMLKISLRKIADEYDTRADELVDEEIAMRA